MNSSCCAGALVNAYAADGITVTVTDQPPTIPPPVPVVALRCPHGELLYATYVADRLGEAS